MLKKGKDQCRQCPSAGTYCDKCWQKRRQRIGYKDAGKPGFFRRIEFWFDRRRRRAGVIASWIKWAVFE